MVSSVPGVGETPYHLVGTGARWTRRGAVRLGRLLAPLLPRPSARTARVTVRVRRVSDINPFTRAAIRLWLAWVFAWRTKWAAFDWYVSEHADGRLLSLAGVVDRSGTVGGVPVRLGLLGGVYTIPEMRGRGLASDVVRRATELMTHDLHCDFGVLLCTDRLVPLYERSGWKRVSNDLEFVRFGRRTVVRGIVMVYECAGRSMPAGTIDVRGLPA